MCLYRFYCPDIKNESSAELAASEAHHLVSVLRLGRGQRVELFDGAGGLAIARIETANRRSVTLLVEDFQIEQRPFSQRIIIAVSVARGERFDWLVGKCTEMGVDRICPVLFERTVKKVKNPKSTERWRNIAVAAAKQSGRLYLPRIDIPLPLRDVLAGLKKDFIEGCFLLGSLNPESPSVVEQDFGRRDVAAIVGPEGGLTDEEENFLRDNSVRSVRLTDTVLRVETAALAFAAVLTAQRDATRNRNA